LQSKSQKVKELPLRKQLEIKRESTYRTTQQEGDKWIGIVKLNREKDSLNFAKHERDNAASVTFFPSTPLNDFHNRIEGQLKQMEIQSQGAVLKKEEAAL
jgi:U3 small nucleolar RNA-associated protein 14